MGILKLHKFYYRKNLILLEDAHIEKIQVTSMVFSGGKKFKYFISYEDDNHKIKPLRLMFPKTTAYVKNYDGETKWMYYFIEDDELLERYNGIWNRVSNSIKK